ncbi:FlgD immunoglobulin-like domain containing protein [Salinibacter grassmerensis]|uniref:FlgD immunoglobulin-like domain containing protein n=1 Tax=Salinibacter grassmerensis TaxID=3040353 RepID=UPI0021E93539|nr:FlgD immunoglobulin-like domain containing protein [Salinibacter grassmerensis]
MWSLHPAGRALFLSLLFALSPLPAQAQTPNAWINEVHYDNAGGDTDEVVEVVIEDAGSVALGRFQVLHYNGADGDSDAADPVPLDAFTPGATTGGFSLYSYNYTDNGETLQNGTEALALCFDSNDDGTFEALVSSGGTDQFLSYEGTLTGTSGDGCAGGKTSTPIGADESTPPPVGESVQLEGSGTAYSDFTWTGPLASTPGTPNTSQTLSSSVTITVDDDGPADYASIQNAIDATGTNTTIQVLEGLYTENVTVDKQLTLKGANAGTPGDSPRGGEATIEGQVVISASDVTLDGFDVAPPPATSNTTAEALRVSNAPDNVVVANTVVRDFEESGLPPWEGLGGIVAFGGNSGDAIDDLTIADNKVQNLDGRDTKGGAAGISIQGHVDGATVTGNTVANVGMDATTWAFGIVVRGTDNHGQTPTGVDASGNDVSTVQSAPTTSTVGVGFGFEDGTAGTTTVAGNSFNNTELQVEDKTAALDLDALLADNTFDRAVVIRNANGDVKDESGVQKIYSPISPAVTAAAPGETVEVHDGTYAETVTVDKALTLQDASTPTVDAFEVAADNVTIDGFKITGGLVGGETAGIFVQANTSGHTFSANNLGGPGSGAGLRIRSGVSGTEITENNISDWAFGVDADTPGQNVQVTGNCISNNSSVGVRSSGGQILTASGNYWGASSGPSGDYPGTGDAVVGAVTVDFSPEPVAACTDGDPTPECTATTLGESVTPPEDGSPGVVTATFTNTDGLEEIEYTKLENFTVTGEPSGFTRSGDTWTADDPQNPPAAAVFDLTQTTIGDPSTYFAIAASTCPTKDDGRLEVNFDPVHELSPAAAAQFAGNAPNPFGDRTTIKFALPEQTDVTLTVYDMMGRRVATLVDGPVRAGTHQIPWTGRTRDGQALASGVYLLRLRTGEQAFTRRMTLVR